jgi:bacterial surface protein 26-residue repeat
MALNSPRLPTSLNYELLDEMSHLIKLAQLGLPTCTLVFKGKGDFNSDISHWDVSNVTNFHQTFFNASSFNVDIGNWGCFQCSNNGEYV